MPPFIVVSPLTARNQPAADDAGLLHSREYQYLFNDKTCLAALFYDGCKDMFQPHRGHASLQEVVCQ